jgi:hypothetical protein
MTFTGALWQLCPPKQFYPTSVCESLECSRVITDKGERKSADESTNAASTAGAVVVAMGAAVAGVGGHPLESILGAGAFAAVEPFLASGFTWIGDVLKRGAARSRRRVEDLLTDLDASPEQRELLIKALELARSTSLEAKRSAIAEALARGVTSAEVAVGETDFLRLLADLDAAHVEALQILGTPSDLPRPSRLLGTVFYEPADLGEINPILRGHEQRLLAVLESHGLAEHSPAEGLRPIPSAWSITSYGLEVLARFQEDELPS